MKPLPTSGQDSPGQNKKPIDWASIAATPPATPLQQCGVAGAPSEPLEHAGDGIGIGIREVSGFTVLRLHSLQPEARLRGLLADIDIPLPPAVNQSHGRDPSVLCLAPRQWLLFSEFLTTERLVAQLQPVLDPVYDALLDLTDGTAVFRLDGPGAPWLLNKLCGLDVRSPGNDAHCARTRLHSAPVTLHYHPPGGQPDGHVFDVLCDRSLARYVWELLEASRPHAEQLYTCYGYPS